MARFLPDLRGTEVRALLALGLPLAGSHLAQVVVHVTDTVMLGWYSVQALAAGVLGASSFFVLFVLGSGAAQAVMPMVAAALGRGDEAQVRRDTRMAMWLSLGFSAVIYPVFWYSGQILLWLGQDPEVAKLTGAYLRIVGLGMAPALLVMVLKSFLSAMGRTQMVLWATVAGAVVNIGFNWMFIFGNLGAPEMGAEGAALASVLVQLVSFVLLAVYAALLPSLRPYALFVRFWRADWAAMRRVFAVGWPIGLTGLSETGLFQASALMMGWIGTMELAAHGIALEAATVAFMLHMGLSNAGTILTGRADGAGERRRLRQIAWAAGACSLLLGLVVIVIFLGLPKTIILAFLDPADPLAPQIVAYGSVLLAVAALFQLADAGQVVALGLLRGLRDTRVPMILAAISYWLVGVPASYVLAFPLGLGGVGLWLGLVIGLLLAAVLLLARFAAQLASRPV
jgi:MATE family multidrug resistance protein